MALYAIENLDDAIDATRAFLFPFDLGRWLRLALIAFFVGGTSGAPTFQWNLPAGEPFPGTPGTAVPVQQIADFVQQNLGVIVGLVLLFLVVGLVLAWFGATLEFAFIEALRTDEVHVRHDVGRYAGKGLRLLAFRIVVGLAVAVVVAILAALAIGPALAGQATFSVVAILTLLPIIVILAVAAGLVNGFTTAFVVPVMVLQGGSILGGWRRFWATMTDQWKQYLAYAVVGFLLTIAAGIVGGIAFLIALVVLLIPFGILALGGVLVGGTAGAVIVALVLALFVVALLVAVAFIQVPIQSYLRYYALLVLGDTDESLDLIPERRAAVRE